MSHQFRKLISERVNICQRSFFCIILQLKLFSRKLTLLIETSVKFSSLLQLQLGPRILFIILIWLCIDYADSCCINLDNWNIPQQYYWNNFAWFFFVSWWKRKQSCWDTCTQFLIFNAWKVLWNWIVSSQNSFVITSRFQDQKVTTPSFCWILNLVPSPLTDSQFSLT